MSLFDSRNILDRIQDTFTAIFNAEWKKNLAPFIILFGINLFGGVIIAVIASSILIPLGIMMVNGPEKGILIGLIVCVIMVMIGIFYWITGNLATIASYLIIQKRGIPFQPMEIILEAKSYLRQAISFDGYYYSVIGIIVFALFLTCFPILQDNLRELPTLMEGPMDYDRIIRGLTEGILVCGSMILVFLIGNMWFSTRYFTNKPGYILEGGGSLDDFRAGSHITEGNFWNILGNIIILGIILSIVSRTITDLLSGVISSSPSIDLSSLEHDDGIDALSRIVPLIASSLTSGSSGASISITIIVSMLTSIYRNAFSYVLWNELRTAESPDTKTHAE